MKSTAPLRNKSNVIAATPCRGLSDLVRRMKRAVVVVLLLSLRWINADPPPVKVTVAQLLATPEKFDGKRVDVTGYYRGGLEERSLLADAQAAQEKWTTTNSIWLECAFWLPMRSPLPRDSMSWPEEVEGRTVRVVGTFHYQQPRAADKREGRREVVGYGYFHGIHGGWARAITDMTYFRPTP